MITKRHLAIAMILCLLAGILPGAVWHTGPVQAVFDVPYAPPITAQTYQIGQPPGSQYTTTLETSPGHYQQIITLQSQNYQDEWGNWHIIDTSIQPSHRPSWDWEVSTGHWQLLVNNDTTVAVKKGQNYVGSKLYGIAYLDITTKDYTILQTINNVTPIVTGNTITWDSILYGTDYLLHYTNDSLKEELVISQATRDLLATEGYRPSDYGYAAANTFLVVVYECDWSEGLPMTLADLTSINPDEAETDEAIYFQANEADPYWKTTLVSCLPVYRATSGNPTNPSDPEAQWVYQQEIMRKRLINANGRHWLLTGANLLALNAMPEGEIILDPTLTLNPNAAGDACNIDTQSGCSACNSHYTCIDEAVADDATSYVRELGGAAWTLDLYNLPDSSGETGTINNVTLYYRVRSSVTGTYETVRGAIKAGSTTDYSTAHSVGNEYGSMVWHTYSDGVWATNPDDAAAWEWADIDDLQAGISLRNPGSQQVDCTQVYVIVYYEEGGTPPTVVTLAATSVESTTATLHGNATATSGNIHTRGFAWGATSWGAPDSSTSPATSNYTNYWELSCNCSSVVQGRNITSLTPATTYYFRFAANSTVGADTWGWGDELSFLTKPAAPTNVAASDGTLTSNTTVTWNASVGNVTGYWLLVDGTPTVDVGNVTAYNYTSAAPTITPGTSTASDGSSTAHVVLSISGEVANNGTTNTYSLMAYNAAGNSSVSANDTGFRGVGSLTYQWYRSSGAPCSGFSQIGGATTDPYNDTAAPAPTITPGTASATDAVFTDKVVLSLSGETGNNGATRCYLCELSATGAASQNTTTDTGYRGTDTLTYQWYRSSGDADSGYSTLAGATTDPYNDTTAPQGSILAGDAVASDGTSTLNVSLYLDIYGTAEGAGRYYRCEVSMNGATSQNSTSDRGNRGVGAVSYQWYRSSGDADSGYSQIIGGTLEEYEDAGAPAPTVTAGNATASDGTSTEYVTLNLTNHQGNNGAGRYFLCEQSAAGAETQNSTSNRGYRGITTLTFQWMRSAADSDAAYSNIGGATTVPYNDTGGVEDPDGRYYKATVSMSGASSQNSTPDRGYEQAADEPTVVTLNASNLACTTATLSGNITDVTGGNATTRGFQYGTSTGNYSWSEYETGSFGVGNYSLGITSLTQNSTWYYRAFAVNGEGTGYGSELSFNTTATGLPTVTNSAATGITDAEATLHGTITDTGCAGQTVSTRGFQWGTSTGNYSWNWTQSGSYSTGAFSHEISSLSANTTYYWRSLATNPAGSNYSAELYFTTEAEEEAAPTTVAADMSELIDYLEELFGGPMGIVATMFAIALLGFAIWKKGWIRIVLALGVVIWGAFATSYDIKIGAPLIAIGVVLFFLGLFQVIKQHRQAAEEAATE